VTLLAKHDGLTVGVASYEILNADQAELAVLSMTRGRARVLAHCSSSSWPQLLAGQAYENSSATYSPAMSPCCEPAPTLG
jgi:hypothetical protein